MTSKNNPHSIEYIYAAKKKATEEKIHKIIKMLSFRTNMSIKNQIDSLKLKIPSAMGMPELNIGKEKFDDFAECIKLSIENLDSRFKVTKKIQLNAEQGKIKISVSCKIQEEKFDLIITV